MFDMDCPNNLQPITPEFCKTTDTFNVTRKAS